MDLYFNSICSDITTGQLKTVDYQKVRLKSTRKKVLRLKNLRHKTSTIRKSGTYNT